MQMLIFHINTTINAKMYCDSHIRKIPIELCQMMGNCFTLEQLTFAPKTQKGTYRKHTHYNHPISKWVRESSANYDYMWDLAYELFKEYKYRFNKEHYTKNFLNWLRFFRSNIILPINCRTSFIQAIPTQYKQKDVVGAYRNYYINEKSHLFKWTKREKPYWIN